MENLQFVDCAPNAGGFSFAAEKVAKSLGLKFIAPISRSHNRAHGYDYQEFETRPEGQNCLFLDEKGQWWECITRRPQPIPGSTYLEKVRKYQPAL